MRTMLKILSTLIITSAILLASATMVSADGEQNCITNYGGKVECNTSTPPSPTVNAGLEDLNPLALSAIALTLSGVLFIAAKRKTIGFQAVVATLFVLSTLFVTPTIVSADGENCITNYGGKVECNTSTPPSPTVNAGLEDLNLVLLGTISLVTSGAFWGISSLKSRTRIISS
jgi:hypothetical protein